MHRSVTARRAARVSARPTATTTLLALLLSAGLLVALGGCNTTAGLGKDVSATGQAVTNAADKVKQGM
jgi:predicted small secreted protein